MRAGRSLSKLQLRKKAYEHLRVAPASTDGHSQFSTLATSRQYDGHPQKKKRYDSKEFPTENQTSVIATLTATAPQEQNCISLRVCVDVQQATETQRITYNNGQYRAHSPTEDER